MSFDEWKNLTLQDVCRTITDGSHFSPKEDTFGLPMASVKDLTRFGIDIAGCKRISSEDFQNLVNQNCAPQKGDVLIAKDGNSSLDTVCVFDQDDEVVLLSSVAILRPNEQVSSDYLFYYLDSAKTRRFLKEKFRSGSAIPRVILRDFRRVPISVPPIEVQNNITRILRPLDEKIKLNYQTNATLEAIAQAIFREWFVNFNFPGTTGEMQASELGLIPIGWSTTQLGQIYRTTSGGTPSRNNPEFYENGTINWIKSKEINGSFIIDTEEKITQDALQRSSAKLLPVYSVLIAMYGATVGEFGIIGMEAACNQAICAFLPNNKFPFTFIYHILKFNKSEIISRAVGSAQQNISQDVLKRFEVILPPVELLQEFHLVVDPLFKVIENNIKQSSALEQIRDSLLPKLMSGEISV